MKEIQSNRTIGTRTHVQQIRGFAGRKGRKGGCVLVIPFIFGLILACLSVFTRGHSDRGGVRIAAMRRIGHLRSSFFVYLWVGRWVNKENEMGKWNCGIPVYMFTVVYRKSTWAFFNQGMIDVDSGREFRQLRSDYKFKKF